MRFVAKTFAGLAAAAVGAYIGLYLLLAAVGLEEAGRAPFAMLIGAGFFGSLAVGLASKHTTSTALAMAVAGGVLGVGLGLLTMSVSDNYTLVVVGSLVIVGCALAFTELRTHSQNLHLP